MLRPPADQVFYELFRKFQVPLHKEPDWLWNTLEKWLSTFNQMKNNVPEECRAVLGKSDLNTECQWLKTRLEAEDSPVVFCHNDMQEGNILTPLDTENENSNEETKLVIIGEYQRFLYS